MMHTVLYLRFPVIQPMKPGRKVVRLGSTIIDMEIPGKSLAKPP